MPRVVGFGKIYNPLSRFHLSNYGETNCYRPALIAAFLVDRWKSQYALPVMGFVAIIIVNRK